MLRYTTISTVHYVIHFDIANIWNNTLYTHSVQKWYHNLTN